MLDNCQKIFKIQLQSKSESGGVSPPEDRKEITVDIKDMRLVNQFRKVRNQQCYHERSMNDEEKWNVQVLATSNKLTQLQRESRNRLKGTPAAKYAYFSNREIECAIRSYWNREYAEIRAEGLIWNMFDAAFEQYRKEHEDEIRDKYVEIYEAGRKVSYEMIEKEIKDAGYEK